MRVLHTEWASTLGGQERRTVDVAVGLKAFGIACFLATRPGSRLISYAGAKGVSVYPIPFNTVSLASYRRVRSLVRELDIDLVHTHSSKDMWMAGLAAKRSGVPFVRTQHFVKPRKAARSHLMYHLADGVIAVGDHVRQQLVSDFGVQPERCVSISSGQDPSRFDPAAYDRLVERESLGIGSQQIAVGMLCALRAPKGIDELVDAAAALCKSNENLVFLVAGEGRHREALEAHIRAVGLEKRMMLLGEVQQPERYLSALDIFVLASRDTEGTPQALTQAMMMSLPVVATRVGNVPTLADGNMLVVPGRDAQALAEAIARYAADANLRREHGQRARTTAVAKLGRDSMLNDIRAFYDKVLAGTLSRP